jgi:tetratricopeptide (TPR) repeat protein
MKPIWRVSSDMPVSNLSMESRKIKENIYSIKENISTDTWDYVLSVSIFPDFLKQFYGLDIKFRLFVQNVFRWRINLDYSLDIPFTVVSGIKFYPLAWYYINGFSEVNLLNRFFTAYYLCSGKLDYFAINVQRDLDKKEDNIKIAKEEFKKAKKLYSKKEYLRASDILCDILTSCKNFEAPRRLYEEIKNMMDKAAQQINEFDFCKITYARGYINYYNAKYKEALNDWKKYISFKGENEEIREYINKINLEISLRKFEKRERNLQLKSDKLCKDGIKKYNERNWIDCIKKMESLEGLVTENVFSKTVEYHNKAKEYINKAVTQLSKNIESGENLKEIIPEKSKNFKLFADNKYMEGLVLYARGKYYEAQRLWELVLRFNPEHKKAKIALGKLKKFLI